MNSKSVKKVLATVLTGAFLLSMGANAADTKKSCEAKGQVLSPTTHKCVDKK